MSMIFSALLGLSLVGATSATSTLSDLPAVERALDDGRLVTVVLDLTKCQPGSTDTKATKTRGGKHIDAYRIDENGALGFADDHFTIGRDGKPIRQFLRYRVYPGGEVDFSMTIFSIPDYQRVGATLEYKCTINNGTRFVATRR